jgi:hypothetical protein
MSCTNRFTIQDFHILSHCFVCFVFISEQVPSFAWLVFVTEMKCVYFVV